MAKVGCTNKLISEAGTGHTSNDKGYTNKLISKNGNGQESYGKSGLHKQADQ